MEEQVYRHVCYVQPAGSAWS